MHKQILLVVLQFTNNNSPSDRIFEHLGVGYIAAYLRQHGYSVKIVDQNLLQQNLDGIIQKVITERPFLVGIACYQSAFTVLQEFARTVKKSLPEIHLAMGGVFATNSYQNIFREIPELDSIILGDGEETFTNLADALLNDENWQTISHLTYPDDPAHLTKSPKYDTDITTLPDPARDTLPVVIERSLFPTISASRGCYGNCSYCSITIQNRKRRCREMISVIDEMERLFKDYRADYFYFIDDTFIGGSKKDYQRIEEFARELEQRKLPFQFSIECRANEVDAILLRKLQKIGLYSVFLGLESGYQPTLDMFRKGITVEQNITAVKTLNELGIRYNIGFIMFHPFTTLQEVEANLNFLMHTEQKNFLDSLHRTLMVFNNAPIADQLAQEGITCQPWYDTAVPFLHTEIQPLYNFVEEFTAGIKPGINQLAVHFSQSNDQNEKTQIARLHSTLCSTYVNALYQYTQLADENFLKEKMDELRDHYSSVTQDLGLKIS